MFSSKSGPSMAWFRVLLLLASLITFSAAKPIKSLRNETSLIPRLAGEYRVRNCFGDEDAIATAVDEISDMASSVTTRISALQAELTVGQEVDFDSWDDEVWSTYDTFQTLFGYNLYIKSDDDNEGGVDAGSLEVLDAVKLAFQELYFSLLSIGGQSLDVWCDSDWEVETDDDGNYYTDEDGNVDTSYLWDDSGNNFGWIIPDPVDGAIVCTDSYMTTPAGYTINSNGVSITTICGAEVTRILLADKTLADYQETEFDENEVFLNDIVNNALSFLLTHEFSHAQALMGQDYFTIDVDLASGQPAYGWEGVVQLASDSTTKAKTIVNADTLAFFAAAMYLDQNTWWDGQSKPLYYSSKWAEDIAFLNIDDLSLGD